MKVPTLLVPYPGPDPSGQSFDTYVYLRPETNGVITESVIMKTISTDPVWREMVKLVYMANYPGDFIQTRHLVEHHYRVKIAFARTGGRGFTRGMQEAFEIRFGVPFDPDRVLGAFDALEYFSLDEEELFGYRVDESDMLVCLGQNIKRRGDLWIVNYDIPALLHKNTFNTDIAVMIFRSRLEWDGFQRLVAAMSVHLVEAGVIGKDVPVSRAFHHSRSPWEQLLDGIEFLWGVDIADGGPEDDISFGAYLLNRGYTRDKLKAAIRRPLVVIRDEAGARHEVNLLEYCAGMTYAGAEDVWNRTVEILEYPEP